MARISPLSLDELPENVRMDLKYAEELMGFTPNDVLTMARWPAYLSAVKALVDVVYAPGELDMSLKRMVATIVSGAAGCRYCQAHTAHGAVKMVGVNAEKIKHVWEYARNPLFSDAERAALDLAFAAGVQPNAATDAHFKKLEQHYNTRQIMEIMGMITVFGLLNRWNDTVATELEKTPLNFATKNLRKEDWEPGRHVKKEE